MENQKSSQLYIGPQGVKNGQSICFDFLIAELSIVDNVVNTARHGKKLMNTLIVISSLVKCLLRLRPKVIYISGSRSLFGIIKELPIYVYGRFKKNIRVISHIHGSDLHAISKSILFRTLINQVVTDWIFLHDSLKVPHDNYLMGNTHVVSNMTPEFSRRFDSSDKKNQVLYLSNLLASKGILNLLRAAKIFLRHRSDWHLIIAGEFYSDHIMSAQELQMRFEELYNDLGEVSNRVSYLGPVNRKEAESLLTQSKIFTLPTSYPTEGVPLSIIEAICMGARTVINDHGHLSSVFGDMVKIVDVRDTEKYADVLIEEADNWNPIHLSSLSKKAKTQWSREKHISNLKVIIETE